MSGSPFPSSVAGGQIRSGAGAWLASTPALFAVPTLIWGSTWLAITFQLGHVPAEVSVAYRFALAALLLAAWCTLTRRSLRFAPRVHVLLATQGVLMFGINYVAIYHAERQIASGLVAVIFSTIVFTSLIGTRVCFGTPITARAILGALFGIGGVALLFVPELSAPAPRRGTGSGIALVLLAIVACTAGNLVSMRMQRAHLPILSTTAFGMLYGAAFAALAAGVADAPWRFDLDARYVASLIYLAVVGSVIAFVAYLTLLKRVGAGPSSYVAVTTPVLAMLLSSLVEGYRWTMPALLGIVLVVLGNVLVLRRAPTISQGTPTALHPGPPR